METLFLDLRHGIRMLSRSPGFTLAAVFSRALGISANTTIFIAINAVLLRRLPYPKSDRLVTIENYILKQPGSHRLALSADLVHWRRDNRVFEQKELTQWAPEMTALSGAAIP
jgi:putative ABC transport system permease protein